MGAFQVSFTPSYPTGAMCELVSRESCQSQVNHGVNWCETPSKDVKKALLVAGVSAFPPLLRDADPLYLYCNVAV